jgi:hypothetical protein
MLKRKVNKLGISRLNKHPVAVLQQPDVCLIDRIDEG